MLDTIVTVLSISAAAICAFYAFRNNAKIHRLIGELEKKESELYMLRSARDAAEGALLLASQRQRGQQAVRKTGTGIKRAKPEGSAPTPAHPGQISDDALAASFIATAAPSPYDHRSYSDSAPNHDSSHSYTSHNSHDSGSDSGGSFGGGDAGGCD